MRITKVAFLLWAGIGLAACTTLSATPPPAAGSAPVNAAGPASTTPPGPATAATAVIAKPAKPEIAAAPLSAEMLYRLFSAEIAGQRGNVDVAVAQYAAAARISLDSKVVERATRIAVFARDEARALEMATLWVDLEPTAIDAHQVAAAMYIRTGQIPQAKAHLQQVIALNGQNVERGFMLVTSLLSKEKDKQVALGVMDDLIGDRRNDPDALYAYGQLAMMVGELQKARTAAEQVITLRPGMAEAHILYSNVLIRQGQKAEALEELHKAVMANPANQHLRHFYARRLVDEKRYTDARDQYVALLHLVPESHEVLYALGLLNLQVNDMPAAEANFRKLVVVGQMVSESNYYLGQIAEARNSSEEAIVAYSAVIEGQHLVDAQIRIALIEARRGDVKKARERLAAVQPDSAESEVRLLLAEGELLREAKLHQEAFEFYNEALIEVPDNAQLLYARALTAEKLEKIDVALADLTAIVKGDPNNAQALNALGYTMVDKTDKVADGMAFIQKAHKLSPEDPAIMDSLGWAHYRMGNNEESLKYLRMAFSKLKDAEIAAHLGEVLWMTGDQDAARTVWNSALRETPSHQLLLDVIKRFTK